MSLWATVFSAVTLPPPSGTVANVVKLGATGGDPLCRKTTALPSPATSGSSACSSSWAVNTGGGVTTRRVPPGTGKATSSAAAQLAGTQPTSDVPTMISVPSGLQASPRPKVSPAPSAPTG